jgi:hypothetical protein
MNLRLATILYFVLLILLLVVGYAYAADNIITVDQIGNNNQVTVTQTGNGHNAKINLGSISDVDYTILQITQEGTGAKSIEVKVDSYSGKKTIETGFVSFNGGSYLLTKEKNIINFWIQLESSIILTIDKGEIIYIKFSDNSVIKFVNTSTDISSYSQYSDKWTNSFSFDLTGVKLEQLKTKNIIGIKCYINEYNFPESTSDDFKNNLNCIIKAK